MDKEDIIKEELKFFWSGEYDHMSVKEFREMVKMIILKRTQAGEVANT